MCKKRSQDREREKERERERERVSERVDFIATLSQHFVCALKCLCN